MDFFGSDIGKVDKTNSAAQCQNECQLNPSCKAWTYDLQTKTCWLKNTIPAKYPGSVSVSGPKSCGGGKKPIEIHLHLMLKVVSTFRGKWFFKMFQFQRLLCSFDSQKIFFSGIWIWDIFYFSQVWNTNFCKSQWSTYLWLLHWKRLDLVKGQRHVQIPRSSTTSHQLCSGESGHRQCSGKKILLALTRPLLGGLFCLFFTFIQKAVTIQ